MHRVFLLSFLLAPISLAAAPPSPPAIIEPETEDLAYSADDIHMATAPFHDADGDAHRCSDWEIRAGAEVVWSATCATGSSRVHIHLGDGTFAAGRTALSNAAAYELRVRHRDDSRQAETEWSEWSERRFRTTAASPMPPLRIRDFLARPAPRWTRDDGRPIELPRGANLSLQLADGQELIELHERDGALVLSDAAPLDTRAAVRAVLSARESVWALPESQVSLYDDEGVEHTIFLPAALLPTSVAMHLWISENGSTHNSEPDDRAPDFTRIARGAPVPWTLAHKGFRVEHVAGGLQLPINIAFVPHPREEPDSPFFYVTELYGDIKVVTRGGQVRDYATGLLGFFPNGAFPGEGETGLTGIVVEPAAGDVLVASLYLHDGWTYPRIVRLSSDDGGLTATRIATVLDMPDERQAPSHQISNLSIGPDGKVYFHMGDAHHAPHAQDLTTMRGKILRMNLDGSAPEDNPFYDASDGIGAEDYIYALGFRNPFGGAWRAADGMLYEIENGPMTDRFARVDRGLNYGWDGTDDSMRVASICGFPQNAAPVNVAFVQSETYGGSGFPSSKLDRAFITESGPTWASGTPASGKRISEVSVRLDGTLESGPSTFLSYDGTGKATVAGIAAGPDGLYFTSLYKDFHYAAAAERGAAVYRVRWAGYADFKLRVDPGDPLQLELADRSVVTGAEEWQWDFGDDTTSGDRDPVHRYARPGSYLVTLHVTRADETHVVRKRIHLARGSGLRAEYFPTTDLSGSGTRRIDRKIDWEDVGPLPFAQEQFSVRWTGRLLPRVSELHRFFVETSGEARLWIDGHAVDGAVALEAGRLHDIVVEYIHRGTGAPQIRLDWESDSQERAVVPPSVLFAPEVARRRPSRS